MRIDEINKLWGISVKLLKEYNKRYRLSMLIYYISDILIFSVLVLLMLINNAGVVSFYICCIIICFAFTIYSNVLINKDKSEVCKFYRRHCSDEVIECNYELDETRLFSILYCSGCKRVKEGKPIDYYLELLISHCITDYNNAKIIMKYISKYEVAEPTNTSIACYIIRKPKRSYFVDFKLEGDLNNE